MAYTDGWSAVAELAASQHGAFHRSQAAPYLSSRTLRRAELRGRLRRPLANVFVMASHAETWLQRLACINLVGGTASHRAAAALHGLDGFNPGRLEVTFARGRVPAVPWVSTMHKSDFTTTRSCLVKGIETTSVVDTLIGLASVVPIWQVEPALDSALRSGVTLDEIDELIDRLWRPGLTGLKPLRLLLHDESRNGVLPDSLFERLVQRIVTEHGLARPMLQYEIPVMSGVRRVDLAWPSARLAVEAHSKRWHFGRSAEADDNARDIELAAEGWEVIYVTWSMAQNPTEFVGHLARILSRRDVA